MSDTKGKLRISRSRNMAGAYTLPYAANLNFTVNDWNAKAVRRERSMRIDYLGDVYAITFTLPMTTNDEIFKKIKDITKGMVFYVEVYNPERGGRQVLRVYRTAITYSYIGEGSGIYDTTDFEWIGMDTQ